MRTTCLWMVEAYQNKYINKRDIKTYHLSVPCEKRAQHLAEGAKSMASTCANTLVHLLKYILIPTRWHTTFYLVAIICVFYGIFF